MMTAFSASMPEMMNMPAAGGEGQTNDFGRRGRSDECLRQEGKVRRVTAAGGEGQTSDRARRGGSDECVMTCMWEETTNDGMMNHRLVGDY